MLYKGTIFKLISVVIVVNVIQAIIIIIYILPQVRYMFQCLNLGINNITIF